MEVILREHVENLGRRGDVVKVAAGYARNFLLPRKLALAVNEQNRRQVERERKVAEARELARTAGRRGDGLRLAAADIVLARRVGEHDALYGSVTSADIAEALTEKGFDIEKRKIVARRAAEAGGRVRSDRQDPPRRAGAREGEDRGARRRRARDRRGARAGAEAGRVAPRGG